MRVLWTQIFFFYRIISVKECSVSIWLLLNEFCLDVIIFFKIRCETMYIWIFIHPIRLTNPLTRIWPSGKVSSNFFPNIIEMSKLCLSVCLCLSLKVSDVFSKKLMLRWPIANLFTFCILKWCKLLSRPSPEFWAFLWILLFNVVTKTWRDLKRHETTYNEHETTWKNL